MRNAQEKVRREISKQRTFLDGAIRGGNEKLILRESLKLNALINRFYIIENNRA